jgi:uncharacterized protein YecE (DUF72 family)
MGICLSRLREPAKPGTDGRSRIVNMQPSISIGTVAWNKKDWRGVYYPERLNSKEWLAFHSQRFGAVEVDSTFYHAPVPKNVARWAEVTPPDFLFSLKLTEEITHERRLRDCDDLVAKFIAGLAPLRSKLACVLIQLPPSFKPDRDERALREFVPRLPSEVRWAIEFRDEKWHAPRIAHLLEEHRVCWVWNDTSTVERSAEAAFGFWPHTTDFLYLRLVGDLDTKYDGGGSPIHQYREVIWPRDAALANWAEKVRATMPGMKRVLIYGANHYEGFAPATAARIAGLLGQHIALPTVPELEGGNGQMELL